MKTKTKFRLSTLIAVESMIIMVALILNIYKIKIEPTLALDIDYAVCSLNSVDCLGVDTYYPPEIKTPQIKESATVGASVKQIIAVVAEQEGMSVKMMLAVAECESGFNPKGHNLADPYGGARGLYQIILYWHPAVDLKCAEDVWCSARYFAQRQKQGDGSLWACYNIYLNN